MYSTDNLKGNTVAKFQIVLHVTIIESFLGTVDASNSTANVSSQGKFQEVSCITFAY